LLIAQRRGPRAALRPAPRDLVLLADARLVGEPDLYRLAARFFGNSSHDGGEIFLKQPQQPRLAHDGAAAPRACGIQAMQLPAEDLLCHADAVFLENPLSQVDQPPANDPVNGWVWTFLDRLCSSLSLEGWPTPCRPSSRRDPWR